MTFRKTVDGVLHTAIIIIMNSWLNTALCFSTSSNSNKHDNLLSYSCMQSIKHWDSGINYSTVTHRFLLIQVKHSGSFQWRQPLSIFLQLPHIFLPQVNTLPNCSMLQHKTDRQLVLRERHNNNNQCKQQV